MSVFDEDVDGLFKVAVNLDSSTFFLAKAKNKKKILNSDLRGNWTLWLMKAKAFVENSQIDFTVVDTCKLNTFDILISESLFGPRIAR